MALNEHAGHRERLKKRFLDNGFDGFEPHQILEMYLFYAIPRKDTNPLAHRLLDRYLTISGVCDAPIDELQRDFGLSLSAATYLKMLPEMSRVYMEASSVRGTDIDLDTIGELMSKKFIGRTSEAVALVLGNAKGRIIYFDIVAKGSLTATEMPIRKIIDLALRHNATSAFIAHNHPSGSLIPSSADVNTTMILRDTLHNLGVALVDHFVVANGEYISMRNSTAYNKIFST